MVQNNSEERGLLIQCQHATNGNVLQDNQGIESIITARKINETKYQKKFNVFVITNSIGFNKNAINIAKKNDVNLISRNDLIEFIRLVNVPSN